MLDKYSCREKNLMFCSTVFKCNNLLGSTAFLGVTILLGSTAFKCNNLLSGTVFSRYNDWVVLALYRSTEVLFQSNPIYVKTLLQYKNPISMRAVLASVGPLHCRQRKCSTRL